MYATRVQSYQAGNPSLRPPLRSAPVVSIYRQSSPSSRPRRPALHHRCRMVHAAWTSVLSSHCIFPIQPLSYPATASFRDIQSLHLSGTKVPELDFRDCSSYVLSTSITGSNFKTEVAAGSQVHECNYEQAGNSEAGGTQWTPMLH